MTDLINIELTKDEALVLFDFLGRFNKSNHEDIFQDQAEQKTLWNLEALLEKTLSEPFMTNYKDIIKQSRDNILDRK
jgi:hypothetical protein